MPNKKKKQKINLNIQLLIAEVILLSSFIDLIKIVIEKFF